MQLLPDRGVFWLERKTLIVADTHFGKSDRFREAGIPVPSGTTRRDLERLDALLGSTGARELIVLGDFFHAREGRSDRLHAALAEWRARHAALEIAVVRGNHDRHAGDPPADWGIRCVQPPWVVGGVEMVHEPESASGRGAAMAGHVHPVLRMPDADGSIVRWPCYHHAPGLLTLPAFGSFTGGHPVRRRPGDAVYIAAPDGEGTVFRLPG